MQVDIPNLNFMLYSLCVPPIEVGNAWLKPSHTPSEVSQEPDQ